MLYSGPVTASFAHRVHTDTAIAGGVTTRISCPGCGRTVIAGKCSNCGKPPMASQLKWALLSLVAIIVLAVMSLSGGAAISPGAKKPPAAAAPAN